MWIKLDADEWAPCDETPVLWLKDAKGRVKIVSKRELIDGCSLYNPRTHRNTRPKNGRLPHYYSCPVLRRERIEWARHQRRMQNA